MSNHQTENPESQIAVPNKPLLPRGCLILLVAAIIVCIAPLSLPKLTTLANQIKWHDSGITNYSISIIPIGYTTWPDNLGTWVVYSSEEGHKNIIDDLFRLAYECFIFCSVQYDPQYGYPTRITKGFIEGGWLEITVKPNTP